MAPRCPHTLADDARVVREHVCRGGAGRRGRRVLHDEHVGGADHHGAVGAAAREDVASHVGARQPDEHDHDEHHEYDHHDDQHYEYDHRAPDHD